MHTVLKLVLLPALAAPLSCYAEGNRYSPQFDACMARTSMENSYPCYEKEIAFQKRRLNAAYGKLVKRKSPEDVAVLNAVQKDWIKWRDGNYNFLTDHVAGSGITVQVVSSDFMLDSIVNQANLLESINSMEGGD